jgi:hypothetical protein
MSIAPKLLQKLDKHSSDVTSVDFFGSSLLVTGSRYKNNSDYFSKLLLNEILFTAIRQSDYSDGRSGVDSPRILTRRSWATSTR